MKTTKYPPPVREFGDINLTPTEAADLAQAPLQGTQAASAAVGK